MKWNFVAAMSVETGDKGAKKMVQDRSAQFMGVSIAVLFGFVLVLNAVAF